MKEVDNMGMEMVKKKFPVTYQMYLYAKDVIKRKEQEKQESRYHRMTDEERMKYDAALYEMRIGKPLDWNNLETYTEKMQWAKLFDKDERKVTLSDKYAVRSWVEDKIGSEYLIPLVGKWDSYKEINFQELPEQFVLKTNHGSGDAVIVRDKTNMSFADKIAMRRKIQEALRRDYGTRFCEWHYSKIKPCIIAEQYIESGKTDLQDYKFLCFDGEPYFCWVDVDRYTDHKRNVYDLNWNLQNWNQRNYGNAHGKLDKPQNFEKMVEIARVLSQGFSHVRVDLYSIGEKVYFGEMTFTNGSGFEEIEPHSANLMLGRLWKLSMNK